MQLCGVHHPEHAPARRRNASRGGKRGGRGRHSPAVAQLARLREDFEGIAARVESGELDRGKAAVMIQALNGACSCVAAAVKAREVEELEARLDALEDQLDEERRGVR